MEKSNVIKTGGCRIKTFLPMLGYSNSMFSSKVFLKPSVFNIICTFLTLLGSVHSVHKHNICTEVSALISKLKGLDVINPHWHQAATLLLSVGLAHCFLKLGKTVHAYVVEQLAAQKTMKSNFSLNFAPFEKNSLKRWFFNHNI